jgi:hypothetical protein
VEASLRLSQIARQWGGLRRLRLEGVVEGADRVLRVLGESPLGGCLEELHAQSCWVRQRCDDEHDEAVPPPPRPPLRAELVPLLLLALPQLRRMRALSLRLTVPDDGSPTAPVAPWELERMVAPMRWREDWRSCGGEEESEEMQGGEGAAAAGPPVVRITWAFDHGVEPAFARALMARHPGLLLVTL